jgi:teichuronic acid exporter
MSKSLKQRTISAMIWTSVQKFGTMGIGFVSNLVLARLLTPADFGIIGMIAVFITISGTLVDGGFASALIQKKNPTKEDYSTIFYWNLFISTILFIALYLGAPAIERFYNMPDLSIIIRVQGLVLIINAFNIIQVNQLRKQLNFKRLANINIRTTIFATAICIIMAFMGYGVWSLVIQIIAATALQTIFLWYLSSWRPSFVFSMSSFKELFGFGAFILLTSIMDKLYRNIQALIIGRVFSATDLGFYTQAKKLEDTPVTGLSVIVNQVTYPVYSQIQDDLERMKRGISQSLRAITFLNFPLMILLIVIGEPLILFLFTDKWSESIPYFQILCFGGMFYTLCTINNNIFKSLGKSRAFFWVQLTKRVIGAFMLMTGIYLGGMIGLIWAVALTNYVFFVIGAYYSSKLSGYKILHQLTDIAPSLIFAVVAGIVAFLMSLLMDVPSIVMIIIQTLVYLLIYLGLAYFFKLDSLFIFYDIIAKKILKIKK